MQTHIKEKSKCGGNSPATGEFPIPNASNAEKDSIWWRFQYAVVHRSVATCTQQIRNCINTAWKLKVFNPSSAETVTFERHSQYCCWWWPGPLRRQAINIYGTDNIRYTCTFILSVSILLPLPAQSTCWELLENEDFLCFLKYLGDFAYMSFRSVYARVPLQWRHNGHDRVSNYQPHDCLLNRLFRRRSKKTSKLRVTGLCAGNSTVTGEFPAQMASNAENVSIWWRHHVHGKYSSIT